MNRKIDPVSPRPEAWRGERVPLSAPLAKPPVGARRGLGERHDDYGPPHHLQHRRLLATERPTWVGIEVRRGETPAALRSGHGLGRPRPLCRPSGTQLAAPPGGEGTP